MNKIDDGTRTATWTGWTTWTDWTTATIDAAEGIEGMCVDRRFTAD